MKRIALVLGLAISVTAGADDVRVAVAANFTAPAKQIAQHFERDTGHKATLSFGGTGKLYAQIRNGAPFDVMLAGDDTTPARLEAEGVALAGTRFTYATGRLVLWSARPGLVDDKGEVLKKGGFRHIAIANPRLAPYGAAAVETLTARRLLDAVQPRLVQAENIAQAHQFVATGNAELGFVALSQLMKNGKLGEGSAWVVPASLHQPIRQDAVIIDKGKGKPAAEAWMKYLNGDKAKAVIKSFGYEV
ncbi:MAG: molybdate ABC transporter substrate-binding protein [Sulfuritalea sp.]|nr:molybdate ABC transporter substrate-binding protein [Sulfuritalea sp.]